VLDNGFRDQINTGMNAYEIIRLAITPLSISQVCMRAKDLPSETLRQLDRLHKESKIKISSDEIDLLMLADELDAISKNFLHQVRELSLPDAMAIKITVDLHPETH